MISRIVPSFASQCTGRPALRHHAQRGALSQAYTRSFPLLYRKNIFFAENRVRIAGRVGMTTTAATPSLRYPPQQAPQVCGVWYDLQYRRAKRQIKKHGICTSALPLATIMPPYACKRTAVSSCHATAIRSQWHFRHLPVSLPLH